MALSEIPFCPHISVASGISLLTNMIEHILYLGFILLMQKDQVFSLFGSSSSC